MLRRPTENGIKQAARRPLKIFAADPLLGRTFGNRAQVDVVNEPLNPGPVGSRLEVIDYDGSQKTYYEPVNLDLPQILMQGGLEPSESDPRFHQQMVYAVALKTLENFDRALGRVLRLGSSQRKGKTSYKRLRLFPHAFYGANAFYNPDLNAILFGYFKADAADVGANLPGQTVFTCLSHDVIAHEMTHAIVDRLRPLFLEPSNVDVLAFHEGFADIVALFQHFSFQDILRDQIQRTKADIRSPGQLVELAKQFGFATGGGKALRSALDKSDARRLTTVTEPHDRGAILVGAVFDGFFIAYQRRINDLIRIATGGTGTLPQGDLHPDLVNRIAGEASKTAQRVLDMCIRAFDYMPPVDVTFGDFLRAMVTADFELVPDDPYDTRGAMIEAFRLRGVYPEGVGSLAEESLLWENAENLPKLSGMALQLLQKVFFDAVQAFEIRPSDVDPWTGSVQMFENEEIQLDVSHEMAVALNKYAKTHAVKLGLDPSPRQKTQVRGFHTVFRVAPSGRLLIELVIQFVQTDHSLSKEFGGIPFRNGCTLIASSNGTFRYLISKPKPMDKGDARKNELGKLRRERQRDYVQMCDMVNPLTPYLSAAEHDKRMEVLKSFANLDAN